MANKVGLDYTRFQADKVKITGNITKDSNGTMIHYISQVTDNGAAAVNFMSAEDLFTNFDGKKVDVRITTQDKTSYGRRLQASLSQDEIPDGSGYYNYSQSATNELIFKSNTPYDKTHKILDTYSTSNGDDSISIHEVKPADLFESFVDKEVTVTIYTQSSRSYGATTNPDA